MGDQIWPNGMDRKDRPNTERLLRTLRREPFASDLTAYYQHACDVVSAVELLLQHIDTVEASMKNLAGLTPSPTLAPRTHSVLSRAEAQAIADETVDIKTKSVIDQINCRLVEMLHQDMDEDGMSFEDVSQKSAQQIRDAIIAADWPMQSSYCEGTLDITIFRSEKPEE